MRKQYDATKEHTPFERNAQTTGRHPNKGRKEKDPYTKQ